MKWIGTLAQRTEKTRNYNIIKELRIQLCISFWFISALGIVRLKPMKLNRSHVLALELRWTKTNSSGKFIFHWPRTRKTKIDSICCCMAKKRMEISSGYSDDNNNNYYWAWNAFKFECHNNESGVQCPVAMCNAIEILFNHKEPSEKLV